MLEKIIGKTISKTHPSSNRLFSEEGTIEKVLLFPSEYISKKASKYSKDKGKAKKAGAALLSGGVKASNYTPYSIVEAAARVSETVTRGILEGLKSTAKLAYNSVDKDENSIVKKWVNKAFCNYQIHKIRKKRIARHPSYSQGRRQFVKDSLVVGSLLAVDGYLAGKKAKSVYNGWTQPITEFSNKNVLIYCVNYGEHVYVDDTLPTSPAKPEGTTFKRDGLIREATIPTNGSRETHVNVIRSGEEIPEVDGGYDIVQFRGHDQNMMPLVKEIEDRHVNGHVIYIFGGCNSDDYIGDVEKRNRAVIAGNGEQDGSQNTYMVYEVINKQPTANNWTDLSRQIKLNSDKARAFLFPGEGSRDDFQNYFLETQNQNRR